MWWWLGRHFCFKLACLEMIAAFLDCICVVDLEMVVGTEVVRERKPGRKETG